jgi:putative membrane protein
VRTLEADEQEALREESNPTNYLLYQQFHDLHGLTTIDQLDGLRLQSLDLTLRALLDIQGGCERIRNTPVPPGYGFIATILIQFFSFLFPFAIVEDVSLMVIPINVLVCLSFALIGESGRVIEDPFSLFWNGLPLQNMADTIEHNLRNRLGEPESALTPIPGPDEHGVLM